MTEPTILIQFDRETWTPTTFLYQGETDVETNRLKEIMAEKFPDRPGEENRHEEETGK